MTMSNKAATVIIVDDDDSVRRALARLLIAAGYSVRTFSSALDLLTQPALGTTRPDCLLVDIRMPQLSGFELGAILHRTGSESPIVFMTGNLEDSTVKSAETGAVEFLRKPFTDDALLSAVQRALDRASAAEQAP